MDTGAAMLMGVETSFRILGYPGLAMLCFIAAFGGGLTGALIYLNLLRISPDAAFSINWTAYTIFIVVIGGLGSLEGPLVGTALFFVVRELLSDYGAWYMILLGALAVGVMLAYPRGLWGIVAERWDLRFFPIQRRVRLREEEFAARPPAR